MMTHKSGTQILTIIAAVSIFPLIAPSSQAQTQIQIDVLPTKATKARLQPIVKGILAAWDKADVVCLGEDHGGKNDSDLRAMLVACDQSLRPSTYNE